MCFRFNIDQNEWQDLPDMPTRRHDHGSVVVGNLLAVVGGMSSERTAFLSEIEMLDLTAQASQWTSLPPLHYDG